MQISVIVLIFVEKVCLLTIYASVFMVTLQVLASKTKIYMVLEYVADGELFERIVRRFLLTVHLLFKGEGMLLLTFKFAMQASGGKVTEAKGRKMFQQLIDGVSYCHNKGVFHRDLKVISSFQL